MKTCIDWFRSNILRWLGYKTRSRPTTHPMQYIIALNNYKSTK